MAVNESDNEAEPVETTANEPISLTVWSDFL